MKQFTVIPKKSHLTLCNLAQLVFWSILSFKNWKVNTLFVSVFSGDRLFWGNKRKCFTHIPGLEEFRICEDEQQPFSLTGTQCFQRSQQNMIPIFHASLPLLYLTRILEIRPVILLLAQPLAVFIGQKLVLFFSFQTLILWLLDNITEWPHLNSCGHW